MLRRAVIILWALLVGTCWGQDYDTRAVVSVIQHDGSGGGPTACGTLIATENNIGLVVTVAHVFESQPSRIVQWQDGNTTPAILIGIDQTMDVAAVLVSNPPADVQPIPLASDAEYPQAGDEVRFIGHGGGNWRHFSVKVLGYEHKREESYNSQLRLGFRPISGDSGGPIIHNGKLVGIQWGGPANEGDPVAYESHATYCGVIEKRLTQWRQAYPNCPSCVAPQPRPVQPRPQPPAPQPQPKPVTPACKCDSKAKACACGPSQACKCDQSKIAALEIRICELEALIKSGKFKGDKGDRGEAGPAGPAGPKGDVGASAAGEKIILAIEQPDGKIVQATGIIGKKPNGKYDRFVLPLKPQPKKK